MILFIFALILGGLLWWIVKTFEGRYGHKCFQLGNCFEKCRWCGVYGFIHFYETPGRNYLMCKWCGKVQDEGQKEPRQCYLEICPKCRPDHKELEEVDWSKYKDALVVKNRAWNEKNTLYHTFTMSPGHPCPLCETKMVKFEPKYNPNQAYKEALYKFHGYERNRT